MGGTGSYTGVLLGTALVIFVRQYGDPLEQVYPLTTWFGAASALVLFIALSGIGLRTLRRLRPRVPPLLVLLGAVGLTGLVFAFLAPSYGLLEGQFQAFGMRAILLSVVLITIMIFRPEGMLGRAEFSWAWLLRERRDQPSDEERAQDAWLTNPELNEDRTEALSNLRDGEKPDGEGEK